MSLFHQPKPRNLAQWLNLATRDLVPSARARIRAEIEAHYAEAVQHRVESGISKPVAAGASLEDLGDAKAAARRFGREYLTQNDALTIEGIYKRSTRGHLIGCIFFVLLYAGDWLFRPEMGKDDSAILALILFYALDLPGAYFFDRNWPRSLAGIDPPPASLHHLLLNHFVANLILGVGCLACVLGNPTPGSNKLFGVLLIVPVFAFSCLKLSRLRKKCVQTGLVTLAWPKVPTQL